MAKKSVIESICDTCGKKVVEDFGPKRRGEFDLPKGWIHLRADNRFKNVFARDICDDCAKPILQVIKQNGNA